jgi:rRNA-processing protein EBP2
VADVNDDLERESAFHRRAMSAFTTARAQLSALGVPVRRPDDYYAEMVKNDAHMRKVKDKLLLEQREADAKVERRKERDSKRYGKEVQAAKLRERKAQQKADMGLLQRMKKRGRGTSATDILPAEPDWGAPDLGAGKVRAGGRGGGRGSGRGKREHKDSKFGFGGRKRGSKRKVSCRGCGRAVSYALTHVSLVQCVASLQPLPCAPHRYSVSHILSFRSDSESTYGGRAPSFGGRGRSGSGGRRGGSGGRGGGRR